MAYEQVKVKTPLILKLLSVFSVTLFLGTWQAVVDWEIVPSTMLASPIQIFQPFPGEMDGSESRRRPALPAYLD